MNAESTLIERRELFAKDLVQVCRRFEHYHHMLQAVCTLLQYSEERQSEGLFSDAQSVFEKLKEELLARPLCDIIKESDLN